MTTVAEQTEARFNGRCQCGQRLSTVGKPQWKGMHVDCPVCGVKTRLEKVRGTFKEDHKCDPRCTGAYGNECICSCGGLNHGRDHGITEVVMAAREPKRERQFIGEVGKHIRGEVTVKRVSHGRFTTYQFETKDGDRLTWFAGPAYDPEWKQGEQHTIRAKVKTHEDHTQYGKSTIVTYVEEVS